jgi:hypothetical protein
MGTDPRKRQKKLERRSAKRKEKRHVQARVDSAGLPEQLRAAVAYPVLHAWIGESLGPQGIGSVVLSRELPARQVAVSNFLVDRYCLGVKDAWATVIDRLTYDTKFLRKAQRDVPARNVPPAEARKLVEQAVAYAHGLGLAPHPDYPTAMILFGDVNAADSDAVFEFGKDGMPFFISGPHDTPERCRQVVAILNKTCGPGKFHYLIRASASDEMIFPTDEEDE